jgi:hypothetical protein
MVNAAFFQRSPRLAESSAGAIASLAAASQVPASAPAETRLNADAPTPPAVSGDGEAVLPPARPSRVVSALGSTATPSDDAIADLINGASPHDDNRRLVLAAQSALAKLGYGLKVDGDANASTMQALGDYEKRHNLPASSAISPRIVKMLTAAVNSSAH